MPVTVMHYAVGVYKATKGKSIERKENDTNVPPQGALELQGLEGEKKSGGASEGQAGKQEITLLFAPYLSE